MPSPLVLKLQQRDLLSEEEQRVLEAAGAAVKQFQPGQIIVHEGDEPIWSCLLTKGWAARSKSLADGRRAITAIHVMGDFVDLQSFLLKPMDHSVVALTGCTISLVPHETLQAISERLPHLTRMLWLSTLIDAAIHREWLVARGQLPAAGQLAHLLCELYLRLQVVGQTDGWAFAFPVTQAVLADALGLSAVHVNRTVQELRRSGAIRWAGAKVTIQDWDGLAAVARFDPTYLNLTSRSR